jgi:hypothetical protein
MASGHSFASPGPPSAVDAYLQQLVPGSRRVMQSSLELVADALSQGNASAAEFPVGQGDLCRRGPAPRLARARVILKPHTPPRP